MLAYGCGEECENCPDWDNCIYNELFENEYQVEEAYIRDNYEDFCDIGDYGYGYFDVNECFNVDNC